MSQHFGLPTYQTFFKDQDNSILIGDMRIVDVLFPMRTAKFKDYQPRIWIVLMKNRTLIENIVGADSDRETAAKRERERVKIQQAK